MGVSTIISSVVAFFLCGIEKSPYNDSFCFSLSLIGGAYHILQTAVFSCLAIFDYTISIKTDYAKEKPLYIFWTSCRIFPATTFGISCNVSLLMYSLVISQEKIANPLVKS